MKATIVAKRYTEITREKGSSVTYTTRHARTHAWARELRLYLSNLGAQSVKTVVRATWEVADLLYTTAEMHRVQIHIRGALRIVGGNKPGGRSLLNGPLKIWDTRIFGYVRYIGYQICRWTSWQFNRDATGSETTNLPNDYKSDSDYISFIKSR